MEKSAAGLEKKIICINNIIKMKRLILVILLLSTFSIYSQNCKTDTSVITGTYKGKNILYKNTSKGVNAIKTIHVNNKEIVLSPNSALVEIPLSYLKIGEKFEVKITYCHQKGSPPFTIINLDEIGKIKNPAPMKSSTTY